MWATLNVPTNHHPSSVGPRGRGARLSTQIDAMALPVIGEDAKMHMHLPIAMNSPRLALVRTPSLSPRSVASTSSDSLVPTLQNVHLKHLWQSIKFQPEDEEKVNLLSRRRFHSSDVVLRTNRVTLAKLRPRSDRRGSGWSFNVTKFTTSSGCNVSSDEREDEPEPPLADPAELARLALRRRTCSENFTKSSRAPSSFFQQEKLSPFYKVDGGSQVANEAQKTARQDVDDVCDEGRRESERSDSVSSRLGSYWSEANASFMSTSDYSSESDGQKLENLRNLQKLYQEGFITVTEYKERRGQLVDELRDANQKTIAKTSDLLSWELPILYREPPEFLLLRERNAIKHVFDSDQRKWTWSRIQVKIDIEPFGRGSLRQVFHLQDLSMPPSSVPQCDEDDEGLGSKCTSYVAKVAIDPDEDPDTYFKDVEMQAVAAKYAKLYNSYNPPRRVEFLEAWILQLIPSTVTDASDLGMESFTLSGTICGVEPFIAGEYHKHNNNYGYVSELERNTPQAFSHFTYEASGQEILVVDIQGVGDHYTDPQIHTRRGKEFGKGNLALRGFERFLGSHRCNAICRYLKLPLINPKDEESRLVDQMGTIPAQTYMNQPRVVVDQVDSVLCHYYSDSMAFKTYTARKERDRKKRKQFDRIGRSKGQVTQPGLVAMECGGRGDSAVDRLEARRRFVTALADQQRSCSTFLCDGIALCIVS